MTTNLTESKRIDDFVVRCRDLGVRVTPQRVAVFGELSRTTEHPAAETIYERVRKTMPAISLDTIYRTLSLLESRQLVWTVATVGGRARYDATMIPHYHFICRSCKSVSDIFSKTNETFRLPKEAAKLGGVDSVSVQLQGTCHGCLRTNKKKRGG